MANTFLPLAAASADLIGSREVAHGWALDPFFSFALGLMVSAALACVVVSRKWHLRRGQTERSRSFARQLLEREEAERKRVALAVHDGLGHQLLELSRAAVLAREYPAADATLRGQLEAISLRATETLGTARDIAYRIRPFELDQAGLRAAVDAMLATLCEGTGVRLFKDITELSDPANETIKLHLFRLIEESVLNVINHSHAANLLIEVKDLANRLTIQISDDGSGFDLHAIRAGLNGGLGLIRIEEHAKAVGGRVEVLTSPGSGTRVCLTIPGQRRQQSGRSSGSV